MAVTNHHYDKLMTRREKRAPLLRSLKSIVDLSQDVAEQARQAFLLAEPYPHVVLDGLWQDDFLRAVAQEIPTIQHWSGEKNFFGSVQKRWLSDWERFPPMTYDFLSVLNSDDFCELVSKVTSEKNITADPYLEGGGVHSTGPGGFLRMHADFNWHQRLQLLRRVNVLIYLNSDWQDSYSGDLLMAQKQPDGSLAVEKRISPIFNRTVIFITDDQSLHGHPEPLTCPEHIRRNSIATYYYQDTSEATLAYEDRRTDTKYI